MRKLVSIIVPVYNVAEYIDKCISSILAQTYENFELILINDCSQDNSGEICRKYAQEDERVVYIENEKNLGGGGTRNRGLKAYKGEYVCFIDSDDYIDNDYIEFLVNNIENYDADIAYAGFYSNVKKKISGSTNIYIEGKENLLKYFLCFKKLGGYVWGKIYKRKVVRNIDFSAMRIGEDGDFALRVLLNCQSVVYSRDSKYFYRIRDDSATQRGVFSDKSFDGVERLTYLKEYLLTHGVSTDFIKKYFPVFTFHVCYSRYKKMHMFKAYIEYDVWYDKIVNILNECSTKAFFYSINLRTKRDVVMYKTGLDKYIK